MPKVYNKFSDKYGNEYTFADYQSFAKFWFGLKRNVATGYFPDNFKALQKAAANSKEARKPIPIQ
jgi:hypothetical protein